MPRGTGRGSYASPRTRTACPGFETVTAVRAGAWQHLAVSYERGMYSVYANGKPVARVKRDMEALVAADDDLHIGAGESGQSGAKSCLLDGLIDEVCIWRRALQAEELASLYDALAPGFASRGTRIPAVSNADLDAKVRTQARPDGGIREGNPRRPGPGHRHLRQHSGHIRASRRCTSTDGPCTPC